MWKARTGLACGMRNPNPTILVADDNEFDRDLVARAFNHIGVTTPVKFVCGGFEAIRYVLGDGEYSNRTRFGFPSFILTDLKMDEGDGFDVLQFLQRHPQWSVVPIVVLTASIDADDIKRAFLLGASAYHVKPSSYKALVHQLIVLHAYWGSTEMPDIDLAGTLAETNSRGKLGARFAEEPAWR